MGTLDHRRQEACECGAAHIGRSWPLGATLRTLGPLKLGPDATESIALGPTSTTYLARNRTFFRTCSIDLAPELDNIGTTSIGIRPNFLKVGPE